MGQSIIKYNQLDVDNYLRKLRLIGSLSALFSDGDIPYLHYRVAENIYCNVFEAKNLARADLSADAMLKKYGIGIKTFLERTSKNFEKIAEFNQQQKFYSQLPPIEKIVSISELRNKRLEFTKNVYGIDNLLYHCITRNKQGFYLFEEPMIPIDISNLSITSSARNKNIIFTDSNHEYKFDISKSTLYKKFVTFNSSYFASIDVEILADPLSELQKLDVDATRATISEKIVVPLYSYKRGTNAKTVFPRSGLNIWNARGRRRDPNEVYIPFPNELRSVFENFFPKRDTPFNVELPNGSILSMKVSQDDGKALTSNPNRALGAWILRDILKIPYGELVTYDMLLAIGIDAVSFEKSGDRYMLNFVEVGGYEEFFYDNILTDV